MRVGSRGVDDAVRTHDMRRRRDDAAWLTCLDTRDLAARDDASSARAHLGRQRRNDTVRVDQSVARAERPGAQSASAHERCHPEHVVRLQPVHV
jgi:hypothetical protein